MGNIWKYSKKGTKQVCGKCGLRLGFDEILLCEKCWKELQQEGCQK